MSFFKIQDGRRRNDEFYFKLYNFKTVRPICTKLGKDPHDHNWTEELEGGKNRKSTSGFMRMRIKIPC